MKKRFLLAPVALGIAGASWAGGTLYGGKEARDAYEQMLADASEATGLALVPAAYEAGFLSSEAITEIRVSDAADAQTVLRLRHVIEHSPIGNSGLRAARMVTTLDPTGLQPDVAGKLATAFGGAVPLTIESVVGLNGSAEHAVTVAAWTLDGPGGEWNGDAMAWAVSQSGDGAVSGTGHWPGLTFSAATDVDSEMQLGASHARFDYQHVEGGVYVGDYVAEIGDIRANSLATGMGGSLSGISLSSSAEIVDELYRGGAELRIDSMDLPIELDSLRFHASFDRFPIAGLSQATKASNELNVAAFTDDRDAILDATRSYLASLESLLQPGLTIGYGLEMANAGGRATADYEMSWDRKNAGDGFAGIDTLGDLVNAVQVRATMDVDSQAFAMTPAAMFLDPATLQPWVISDADGYRADITLDEMVVHINDQAIPLEAMMGAMLEQPLDALLEQAI